MSESKQEESYQLAARLQDAFMSMEAAIPEVVVDGRLVQMSLNQVRALHFVTMKPGVHQKDIARRLAITQASVSLIISKLTSLGLVDKQPDQRDGRAHGLFLTQSGGRVFNEIRREQIAVMEEFLSVIPLEDQRILVGSIEQALANLEGREASTS